MSIGDKGISSPCEDCIKLKATIEQQKEMIRELVNVLEQVYPCRTIMGIVIAEAEEMLNG